MLYVYVLKERLSLPEENYVRLGHYHTEESDYGPICQSTTANLTMQSRVSVANLVKV